MVFPVRQQQEKCQEQNTDLKSTYDDPTKEITRSVEKAFGETCQNTASPQNSSPLLDNFMMTCMQGCKTTEKTP